MTPWLFVPQLLTLLSHGTFFRKLFFYLFRVTAVISALMGLVICAGILTAALRLPGIALIGAFLFIAFAAVAFYAAAHIYWLRAVDIRNLPDGPLTMTPIVAIMLRTVGEVFAVVISVLSIGLFVLFLLAGQEAGTIASEVPGIPRGLAGGGNPFLAGLIIMAFGIILAMVQLAYFYLLAELVGVLAQIAGNTALTAANTSLMAALAVPGPVVTPAGAAATRPTSPAPFQRPASGVRRCLPCGTENPASAVFCENCGAAL